MVTENGFRLSSPVQLPVAVAPLVPLVQAAAAPLPPPAAVAAHLAAPMAGSVAVAAPVGLQANVPSAKDEQKGARVLYWGCTMKNGRVYIQHS